MEQKLENYRYGISTEVLFRGQWQGIVEVWFDEKKIGLKSGHLIDYKEVQDIRG